MFRLPLQVALVATITLTVVVLDADGLVIPLAAAQDEPSSQLPDSALEALEGRRVRIELTSGMEASGELAGFDDLSLTVINEAGKVIVVKRAEVASLAMAKSDAVEPSAPAAGPAAAPAPTASPAVPPTVATPGAVPPGAAPPAAVAPPPGYGMRPPGTPNADEGEKKRASGMRMLIAGAAVGGVGIVLEIIGGVMWANASRTLDCGFDACHASTPGEEYLAPVALFGLGTASLVTAAIITPIGAARFFGNPEGTDTVGITFGPGSLAAEWRF